MIAKRIHIVVFMCVLAIGAQAMRDISPELELDKEEMLIGDHVKLSLSVVHPNNIQVFWPQVGDSIGVFDVISTDSLQTTSKGSDSTLQHQEWVVTVFNPGEYRLLPFKLYYINSFGQVDSALSNPVTLMVEGIEVDTSQPFKPIKPPHKIPYTFAELAPWIFGGLGIIVLGILLFVYIIRRSAPKQTKQVKPLEPPHVVAMKRLKQLKKKALWSSGNLKQHYFELSEILREYLERRYKILALESTTREILEDLSEKKLPTEELETLRKFLSEADLVKFAKSKPLEHESVEALKIAEGFVRRTKEVKTNKTKSE